MAAPGIAIREWLVAACGGATLAGSAWAFGGVEAWSLHILLGGSAATFLLAVIPLPRSWNGSDGNHGNRQNAGRLLRFPVFWIGLLFLAFILIQGLNPSWEQVHGEEGWWMEETEAVAWLPSGAAADYVPMNAFRMIAHFSAGFLLVWGLWVGLRRRTTVVLLLWALVISGVLMALVGILQKFTVAEAVLWSIPSENKHFWGSFFYRNQGVAYLCLIITAAGFLYFYHFNRSERRAESGGPHLLLFVFVAVVAASIGLALSRGGILFGGTLSVLFLLGAIVRWLFSRTMASSFLLTLILAGLLGGGWYAIIQYVDIEDIEERFGNIEETLGNVDEDTRMKVTKVTWQMAQERLWLGWGGGSWRYIFPMYQKSHPELYYQGYHPRRGWFGRQVFRYAHNDLAQFLAEYGIVGCSLLVLSMLCWLSVILMRSADNGFAALFALAGTGVAFVHAFVEFIFHSGAYWVAFGGILCLSAKLLALHVERKYG